MRSCLRKPSLLISLSLLLSLPSLLVPPQGAISKPRWIAIQAAWGAPAPAVPKSLVDFLALDRFHYYVQQLARTVAKRGRQDLGEALRQAKPEKIRSVLGNDPALRDASKYDLLAAKLIKATHPSLQFTATEITWAYPFFKNKLAESFTVIPVTEGTGVSSGETSVIAQDNELPYIDMNSVEADVTLDVAEYAAWKTTRGVFWDAAKSGTVIEYHLGSLSAFLKHVEAKGGKVQGEVRALARNYNRIFVVDYPPAEGGIRYAVTQISGRDRLQHLMQQSRLTPWKQGQSASIPTNAVFGSPVALQAQQLAKFTSIYEALPRADHVIIGQRDGLKKMIRAGAIAQQVSASVDADSSRAASFSVEEKKVLTKYASDGKPAFLSYREDKAWESMADKLELKLEGADVFEIELDLGSHDLTDVLIKNSEGKLQRWRLISNTWGDEIVPISKALAATQHKKITYIGTAGALPGSELKVGDLVTPNAIQDTSGASRQVSTPDNLPPGTKTIETVAHVKTPFQETLQWLQGIQNQAQVVELETAYLAETFAKPQTELNIYLLVSDIVGSEAATLAQSGTDSARATTRKKLLEHLLQSSLAGREVINPRIAVPAVHGVTDPIMALTDELAPTRDAVSRLQVARAARNQGFSTREQIQALLEDQPSFTTAFAEKKLVQAGKTLKQVLAKLSAEGIWTEALLPEKGLADGSWNAKSEPVTVYLDATGQDAQSEARLLEVINGVYQETPTLRKVIELKIARGPPAQGQPVLKKIPANIAQNAESLIGVWERVALKYGGLVARETRSGGRKFTALYRLNAPPDSTGAGTLDFFAPNAETAEILHKFNAPGDKDAILREKILQAAQTAGFDLKYEPVQNLPDGKLASIEPGYKPDGTPFITVKMTPQGARNSMVVLEELVHLSQILGEQQLAMVEGEAASQVKTVLDVKRWFELAWNARAGSPSAKRMLAQMELSAMQTARELAKGNSHFTGPASETTIDSYFNRREAHAQAVLKQAIKLEKTALKEAKKKWETQRAGFNALEADNAAKLNELVAKNDRVGVRNLLEKYLPWPLMEPSERSAWRHWIEAIAHPDPSRVKIVYRGLDKGQLLRSDGKEFMLATVLSKNQGNYNRRLRSLQTMREKIGAYGSWDIESGNKMTTLQSMFAKHADTPMGTPFLSSSELSVARSFTSSEGLSVLRIDERRLLPSQASYLGEFEVLIPLVVFPDEILGRIPAGEVSWSTPLEALGVKVRDLIKQKIGRNPVAADFAFERQAGYVVEGIVPAEITDYGAESPYGEFMRAAQRRLGEIFSNPAGDADLAVCITNAVGAL